MGRRPMGIPAQDYLQTADVASQTQTLASFKHSGFGRQNIAAEATKVQADAFRIWVCLRRKRRIGSPTAVMISTPTTTAMAA